MIQWPRADASGTMHSTISELQVPTDDEYAVPKNRRLTNMRCHSALTTALNDRTFSLSNPHDLKKLTPRSKAFLTAIKQQGASGKDSRGEGRQRSDTRDRSDKRDRWGRSRGGGANGAYHKTLPKHNSAGGNNCRRDIGPRAECKECNPAGPSPSPLA